MATAAYRCDFQDDEDVQAAVRDFHDKKARQPKDQMKLASEEVTWVLGHFRSSMQKDNSCNRFEYTGSSYDGTKIPNGLEYDVIVVMKSKDLKLDSVPASAGEYKIKVTSDHVDNPIIQQAVKAQTARSRAAGGAFSSSDLDLRPDITLNKFGGCLQRILNKDGFADRTTLRQHGSAVQMDFYKDSSKSELLYSVDMVPTLEVDGKMFVTRSAWRLSYAVMEKQLLQNIDRHNTCKRECLRVLKVLRENDAFQAMRSNYPLKVALFQAESQLPTEFWDRKQLGKCVIQVLMRLRDAYKNGKLENPYISGVNALYTPGPCTRNNVAGWMDRLLSNKQRFLSHFT